MSHLSSLKIALNTNGWWLFLLVLTAVFFSMFVYRRTNPPVSKGLKRFLTGCRMMTLFLIIFLLFKPVLSLKWLRSQKSQVAILIDNSASLQLTDAAGDRAAQVQQVLDKSFFKKLSRQNEL
ncbi:hypothetical protein KAH55_07615, partial [bacterium]|nr:hypothetical protein [bacterium]